MRLKKFWLVSSVAAMTALMLLMTVSSAYAAISVKLISVSVPTGMSDPIPNCGGDITVTFSYKTDDLVDIVVDYEVTVMGFPVSGTVTAPGTNGNVVTTSRTFNIPVPIPPSTAISASVTLLDQTQTLTLDADAVNWFCENGYPDAPAPSAPGVIENPPVFVPAAPPSDGRLSFSDVFASVYYQGGDGVIEIYTIDENGDGVLAIQVTEQELQALPEFPATNTLIEQNADGTVAMYKLTSGEYQLNIGPDAEGKVRVIVFTTLTPALSFYTTEYDIIP